MGQIIGGAAKPKRCNLNQLSQVPTPASGEHILVSSDNSMNAAGQGNFDCYIVGDGTTAATALELKSLADDTPMRGSKNSVSSGGVYPLYMDVEGGEELVDLTQLGTLELNAMKADGSIQTNGQYKYYKIPNNGYTHVSGTASTYAGFALVNFYSGNPSASTFISGITATTNYVATDYDLDVPSNCVWICVAWYYGNGNNSAAQSTCIQAVQHEGLKTKVETLGSSLQGLETTSEALCVVKSEGINISITDFTTAGRPNKDTIDGTRTDTTTYKSTGVYSVSEGQVFRFINWAKISDVSGIATQSILCAYKADGTKIGNTSRLSVQMMDVADYENGEYTFIVPKDVAQIIFVVKNTTLAILTTDAGIELEKEYSLTEESVSLIRDVVKGYKDEKDLLSQAEALVGKYITASGDIANASGYTVYKIPNNSYTRIFGQGSTYAGYLCVGFYNGEPSSSTLISGFTLNRSQILQPFDLEVPNSCVFICVAEYNATGDTQCKTEDAVEEEEQDVKGDTSAKYYLKGNSNIVYSASKKLGIIAAGQSNIEGRNSYSDLPSGFVNPNSKVRFCNNVNGTFADFQITDGGAGNDWGFDAILYDALTNPNYGNQSEIYVMKKAMGGTSIDIDGATDYHWTADYEYLSSQTYSLLRTFEKTIREGIETQGSNFEIKAFVWHQGEGDSGSEIVADRYYDNLKNMLSYIRGIVGNPRLHFFCGTISNNNVADPYTSIVNAAYNKLAGEDPYLHLIDMSNAQLEDSWHFNYQWSIYFGQKVYDAFIDAGIIRGTKINPVEPS